jgi:hypothetical protein
MADAVGPGNVGGDPYGLLGPRADVGGCRARLLVNDRGAESRVRSRRYYCATQAGLGTAGAERSEVRLEPATLRFLTGFFELISL